MKGDRPDRPPSGFSDALWELLVWTWVVEDGPESKRRPSPSFILDQLEKSVDQWEKSIVPLVPKRWQEDGWYPKFLRMCRILFMTLLQ